MLHSLQPCSDIQALIDMGGQLIDVRNPMEYQQFAVPGSKNIPLQQIPAVADVLDPNQPIMFVSSNGVLSEDAKQYLQDLGFKEVYNLGAVENIYSC